MLPGRARVVELQNLKYGPRNTRSVAVGLFRQTSTATTALLFFFMLHSTNGATSSESSMIFEARNYDGSSNNVDWPLWGSAGISQLRSLAEADYADTDFTPPGGDRPTAREVLTDVFLSTSSVTTEFSSLFVAWGQLISFDLFLNVDDATDAFDIDCDDGGLADVWCPSGAASDPISFDRSNATVTSSVRSPTNYASSYFDLDFVYGRSEEQAESLRTLENGFMQISDSGIPLQNADGTWLIADQRTAEYPVTFALHSLILLEHNRCCVDEAPDLGFTGDEDIYQACRGWTIASFQHTIENDFIIRLLGGTVFQLAQDEPWYEAVYDTFSAHDDDDGYRRRALKGREQGDVGEEVIIHNKNDDNNNNNNLDYDNTKEANQKRRRLYSQDYYDASINAGADVFATTIGAATFAAMLPPTLRIVGEGYEPEDEDNIELHVASADLAGLFERNSLSSILRGAVLSPALKVDAHFASAVSNASPLFKLPVDAVQRGRDHGLPTYNDARVAYGLTAATSFAAITDNEQVSSLLDAAYGGDVDLLDAVTGALAEGSQSTTTGVLGELLQKSWLEQLYRTMAGDRLYHLHSRLNEEVADTTVQAVIERNVNVSDLPLSVFTIPSVEVCGGDCTRVGDSDVLLSEEFGVSWTVQSGDTLAITLRTKGIGTQGMMNIGWGGTTMASAADFVICEVDEDFEEGAQCTDRRPESSRRTPGLDEDGDPYLTVLSTVVDGGWTYVTFERPAGATNSEEDYDLKSDIEAEAFTKTIYSYKSDPGIGQHPNANRGASEVNFATSATNSVCSDSDGFLSLHGCLMLIAWMILAPIGIYYARYRKGDEITFGFTWEWYDLHQEFMILASEAILPVAITAIFALDADHDTQHAKWGFTMIGAVALQVITGFLRVAALEAKQSNFSLLHRINKYLHIWLGRFAYVAGVVQCYRGLELVSDQDNLVFSAGDGLDLQLGTFGTVQYTVFPVWFALVAALWLYLETKKQIRRYAQKGSANVCGCVELINEDYGTGDVGTRLVPRTEDVPIYTMPEFNDKVLNGQSWVLVDGAILDVSEFSHRHPGGTRLILNAVGTDVTHELLGEEQSVGHAMAFNPHRHPQSAWDIVKGLVIGYIEEDDEEEDEAAAAAWAGGDKPEVAKALSRPVKQRGSALEMLPTGGTNPSIRDSFGYKAQRLNHLATLPSITSGKPGAIVTNVVVSGPADRIISSVMSPSTRALLERFHVCPLLFREKMGKTSKTPPRPVYKYVFTCPGKAQILVSSMRGVGYFNLRVSQAGKGVVQRAYNAFPVRVILANSPDSPGSDDRKATAGGAVVAAAERKVVPANETSEGILCIEMRIRHYHDGAMSQLLEKLANDPDNPAVQLQGPFLIERVIPPPAHRNVVMIAAGTGINPMVQLIRDYQAVRREATLASKSRLALLWQSTTESDLFCADDLTAMQAKSNGLLEVTALISGEHRKRNIPGAAFQRAKAGLKAARRMVSPVSSSPNLSTQAILAGRPPRTNSVSSSVTGSGSKVIGIKGLVGESKETEPTEERPPRPAIASMIPPKESARPQRRPERRPVLPSMDLSEVGAGGLIRGKANREILERVFGDSVMNALEDFRKSRVKRKKLLRRAATLDSSSAGDVDGSRDSTVVDERDEDMDMLCGTEDFPGKLQVVVSGPAGFVFHVETILSEMGVPIEAIVLLD